MKDEAGKTILRKKPIGKQKSTANSKVKNNSQYQKGIIKTKEHRVEVKAKIK